MQRAAIEGGTPYPENTSQESSLLWWWTWSPNYWMTTFGKVESRTSANARCTSGRWHLYKNDAVDCCDVIDTSMKSTCWNPHSAVASSIKYASAIKYASLHLAGMDIKSYAYHCMCSTKSWRILERLFKLLASLLAVIKVVNWKLPLVN